MPRVDFEPTIPVFERAKTVHALDRVATAIGSQCYTESNIKLQNNFVNFLQKHLIVKEGCT
jgi:hypothetical protein